MIMLTIEISSRSSRRERMNVRVLESAWLKVDVFVRGTRDRNQFRVDQTLAITRNAKNSIADIKPKFGMPSRVAGDPRAAANNPARNHAVTAANVNIARRTLTIMHIWKLAPGFRAGRASIAYRPRALNKTQMALKTNPISKTTRHKSTWTEAIPSTMY